MNRYNKILSFHYIYFSVVLVLNATKLNMVNELVLCVLTLNFWSYVPGF